MVYEKLVFNIASVGLRRVAVVAVLGVGGCQITNLVSPTISEPIMKVHVELPLTPEQKEANKKRIEGQKKTSVKTLKKTNECSNCNFGGANLQATNLYMARLRGAKLDSDDLAMAKKAGAVGRLADDVTGLKVGVG